jgi:hypothetical protein
MKNSATVWNARGAFVAIPKFDEMVQLQRLPIGIVLDVCRDCGLHLSQALTSDETQTELQHYSRLSSVYMEKDDLLVRILFCDEAVFHSIRKANK